MTSTPPHCEGVVRRFVDAFNDHDREAFAATLADDFVFVSGDSRNDAATFVDIEFAYVDAFPDLAYTLEDCFAADGEVAFRWTFAGTHEGTGGPGILGDADPTGERVEVTGMNMARVENEQFTELWGEWNGLGLYSQLGLVELTAV